MPPDQLLSTHSAAAVLYREAVVLLVGGRTDDAIQFLRAALLVDDGFAVAHAALALAEWQAFGGDAWRESIARASGQRDVSRRERQHVAVIALVLGGHVERASALGSELLQVFPTDHAVAFALARCGLGRDQVAER
ncbi:MAG: hypothetical protein HZB15_04925 [Actinobacteria bacterium]|nr:hypothetical protein [Actinomycetota bacterium]